MGHERDSPVVDDNNDYGAYVCTVIQYCTVLYISHDPYGII